MHSLRLLLFLWLLSLLLLGCLSMVSEEEVGPTITTTLADVEQAAFATTTPTQAPTTATRPTTTPITVPSPTAAPLPSPTVDVLPSPTAQPAALTASLHQLTTGGCCTQPFFSPDSAMVLFIDKAGDDEVAQIYGVDVGQLDGELLPVVPVYETIGFRSPDQTVVARPDEADGNLMLFTNEQTGQAWTIDTRGNWPVFSPDSRQIFWNVTDRDGPYDERRTDIWAANIDGSEVRMLLSLYGGGAERWFPDGQKLLVIGRAERVGEQERLFVLSIADGTTVELAQEDRLRVGDISPDGAWAIYLSTFAVDPTHNGLFAVRTDGSELRPLDFIGPFRWREADRLLYIPTRASAEDSLVVWELDMTTGEAQPLTDPAQIRFTIDGADWALSPDGRKLVFVSSEDQNLWLINLPE